MKKQKPTIIEHPELNWWFNAITVNAHNMNGLMLKKNKLWGKRTDHGLEISSEYIKE